MMEGKMGFMSRLIAFFGRVFLSLLFIVSGVDQLLDWPGTEQALVKILNDRSALTMGDEHWRIFFSTALSWSSIIVAAAIFFQLIGGLCLLLGIQVRFGAFLLILVLIPVTAAFHSFWMAVGPEKETQMMAFMKNLSILGGLCLVLAHGKGTRRPSPPPESASED